MNVTGAIAGSEGRSLGQVMVRGALAVVLSGAELLAAVALVRVMLAPNRFRQIIGSLIFIGLAWACIQNGKRAVHLVYPEFEQSAALLEAKAKIAGEEASQQATQRQAAVDATPRELERVRSQMAALQAEQLLMASQSPEKISEAQSLLIAQGKYFGEVDGVRGTLTEAAMRSRGEEIGQEIQRLQLRESALMAGSSATTELVSADGAVNTESLSAATQQAILEDQARRAQRAAIWIEVMLWVFEAARSFGLWALVTRITSKRREDGAGESDEDAIARIFGHDKEWVERAIKHRFNFEEGIKDKAVIKIGNKEWARETRERLRQYRNNGMGLIDMADALSMDLSTLRGIIPKIMSADEVRQFLTDEEAVEEATTDEFEDRGQLPAAAE